MITALVEAIKTNTGLQVYAFEAPSLKKCIVYEWTPDTDNGILQSATMMVRIKSDSIEQCELVGQKVKQCLLNCGDHSQNGALNCEQNGGGLQKEEGIEGWYDYVLYFDISFKSNYERN